MIFFPTMFERRTTISSNVIQELEQSTDPLSVPDILNRLEQNKLTPNKTTVYRILEKLIQKKVITEIPIRNGATYYEFFKGKHHHHFICNECGSIFCLTACHVDSFDINLTTLLPNNQFKIQSHDFNLYGTCESCGKSQKTDDA